MDTKLSRGRARTWIAALVVVAMVGALGITAFSAGRVSGDQKAAAERGTSYAESLSQAFRDTAERILPAVVMIRNVPAEEKRPELKGRTRGQLEELPFGDGEEGPFGDLFQQHPELKRFFKDMPSMPSIPRQNPEGMGSGVIIDASGVVLTNDHVVRGGGKIMVRLHDGREFEAESVKEDPKSDLAIVRIKADNLVAAPLGDSDKARVGDWVLALGQPFGLEGTVTAGIISAKGRGLGITPRENFIQTDAAINPGNSGGPLVNLDGEVIGINTAISSRNGGYQGVGFAVPVNLAKWVAQQLESSGKVRRAYLGVAIQPVTQQLAEKFGVKLHEGVLVTDVFPDTPGAQAGLKPGDVIVDFAGTKVSKPVELQDIVERSAIGSKQSMTVVRDGKTTSMTVTVREQPDNFGLAGGRSMGPGDEGPGEKAEPGRFEHLGMEVEKLTPEVANKLGLDLKEGVVITRVRPGSVADMAGLDSGMVVVQVNRQDVKSPEDFRKAMDRSPLDKGVLLLVRSAQGSRFVVLKQSAK